MDRQEDFETIRKKYIVLIIYDITDNKRRTKMVKCLEKYGIRVQKSAFEAYLYKNKYNQMLKECVPIIDSDKDSLRVYLLYTDLMVKSWGIGEKHVEDVIIL